ncbi:Hypoticical protein [Pectobacterium parmentieri]|uniref:Hypoticical protein n=1 Tax=Pectobacterium parmentieri TaxID=1905730 RepID=A0A0H3I302_PECPM|nr:Hypoticical protein [Pectobacterium parmentieri]
MFNIYEKFKSNNKTEQGRIFTLVVYLIQLGFIISLVTAIIIHIINRGC